MKKKLTLCSAILLFIFSLLFFPAQASGDFYIKKIKHTDPVTIMGQAQPAKDEEGATWMAEDKMREDEGESKSTIIRFDLKKIYIIEHDKKSYTEIDLPVDFKKMLPAQARQMMEMMEATAKVTETEETRKVKEWDCKKFLVEIGLTMMGMEMPMKMEMWVTKDLGIDLDLYEKFYSEMLSIQPFIKDFAEEFKKIDGYPVMTLMTMKMMGTETKFREEVLSVEEIEAPVGTYDVPEHYLRSKTYNPFEQKR